MSYDRSPRPVCSTTYGIRMLLMFQIYSAVRWRSRRIASIDLRDGFFEAHNSSIAAQHCNHFVDARANGAAGQRDANRLRELSQLHVETAEHVFEDALNRGL